MGRWWGGDNGNGELGNLCSMTDSSLPVAVNVAVSRRSRRDSDGDCRGSGPQRGAVPSGPGTVAGWGAALRSVGNWAAAAPPTAAVPVAVDVAVGSALSGETVTAIAAGADHTLAPCGDGTAAAWGGNGFGQLGNNSNLESHVPVAVSGASLAAGERWALVANGEGAWHALARLRRRRRSRGSRCSNPRGRVRPAGASTWSTSALPR